jgi:hypothetical protein
MEGFNWEGCMTDLDLTKALLQDLSISELDQIEFGEIELFWEDDQGREGSSTYEITNIADKALDVISSLEQSNNEKFRSGFIAALITYTDEPVRWCEQQADKYILWKKL